METITPIVSNRFKVTLLYSLPESGDLNTLLTVFDVNLKAIGIKSRELALKLNDKKGTITVNLKTSMSIDEKQVLEILRQVLNP